MEYLPERAARRKSHRSTGKASRALAIDGPKAQPFTQQKGNAQGNRVATSLPGPTGQPFFHGERSQPPSPSPPLRAGRVSLPVAVAVASCLFLVNLHCGHYRAPLLPFGTVGNARFGPARGRLSHRETRQTTCQSPTANGYVFRTASRGPGSKGPETLSQRGGNAPDRSRARPTRRV